MRLASTIATLLLGTIIGCNPPAANTPPASPRASPTPPPAKTNVDVKAPGVDIKIKDKNGRDGKADVKVEAPGTRVDVDQ